MATKITEHFNYESFWANSESAKKHHIDNTPTAAAKSNIYKIVTELLEKIAVRYGKAIRVNSSYRCPRLNEIVGGSKTSQHMTGTAVDIAAKQGSNRELFMTIVDMIKRKEIVVGQLIWEYGNDTNPQWVHVSLPYSKRNNIVRCRTVNGTVVYQPINMSVPNGRDVVNTPVKGSMPQKAQDNKKDNTTRQTTTASNNAVASAENSVSITATKRSLSGRRRVTDNYKRK